MLGQSMGANCWLSYSHEVTEIDKSSIHEGWMHDLCRNYASIVYQ